MAFASAISISGLSPPLIAGSAETVTLTGLADRKSYYFALKTIDEAGNVSGLSNCAAATTQSERPGWEAWHNSMEGVADPDDSLTSTGSDDGAVYSLVDSADGSALPATVSYAYTGTFSTYQTKRGRRKTRWTGRTLPRISPASSISTT